ncbi:two-partner secretion domain-containing protein [Vreelandella sp. H-I2]
MNRVYQVVWNRSKGVWQAASELSHSNQNSSSGSGGVVGSLKAISAGTLFLMALPLHAAGLPSGGAVVGGQGSISGSGNTLTIEQNSQNIAINWQDFSIAEGHAVNFVQPNAQAAALNRVTGNNVSDIRGALNANGRVFLVNPNGVMFSSTARVDVGSLVASTLDISTEDFMAGNYHFEGASANAIVNQGNIATAEGGVVAMIAAEIINTGNITTPQGSTLMGAGSKVTLDLGGPVKIEVEEALLDTYIEQGGVIRADGGLVYLTAKAAGELASSVINHTGVTEARTLATGEDGRIMLMGDMDSGQVQVAGTLDASAPKGGDGGFIETSSANVSILDEATVTTKADNGETGEWLIDPNDYTIAANGGDITGAQLGINLADTNVTIKSVDGGNTDGNGDIFVNDEVTWSSGNTLTLNAIRNIEINSAIDASGGAGGKLALEYGQGAVNADNTASYNINAPVNLRAGQNFSTKLGKDVDGIDYTVITDLGAEGSTNGTDLQGMNGDLSKNYALGSHIDASVTTNWNSGSGWTPIGSNSVFTGNFDGLGHSISNLFYFDKSAHGRAGLFSYAQGGSIKNVGILDANITGYNQLGILVGEAHTLAIEKTHVTGSVTGNREIGTLVGKATFLDVNNSYSTANINGDGDYAISGLVGYWYKGSLVDSYMSGEVTGTNGQLSGLFKSFRNESVDNYPTVTNSYYDTDTNAGVMVDSATYGKTKAEIIETTNNHWDTSIWATSISGADYAGYAIGTIDLPVIKAIYKPTETLFEGGMGVEGDAYTIANWDQLQNINYNADVLAGDYHFDLANDLDTNTFGYNEQASASANNGAGWTPIGNHANQFTGTFDGNNHSLSGLAINRPDTDYVGLFGYTQVATIKNLGVNDADINGNGYVGILAGQTNAATLQNVHSSGSVTAQSTRAGGLVGFANSASSVDQSYSTANVIGTNAVGGLIGASGYDGSGGSTLSEVYATGDVKGTGVAVGGLAGESSGSIENAYATGNVEGDRFVGGLVGLNSYGTIKSSYAAGSATGATDIGGLVGEHVGTEEVTNSFYATTDADDNAINQTNDSGLGEGKTWAELMDPDKGDGNTGGDNTGGGDSGDDNTGGGDSGDDNTGGGDSGDDNTGGGDSGDDNTGGGDSGDDNTGGGDSGDGNTGGGDSGDDNTGGGDSGDDNTGGGDSGDGNTGGGDSGDDDTGGGDSGDDDTGGGDSVDDNSGGGDSGDDDTGGGDSGDDDTGGGNSDGGNTNSGNQALRAIAAVQQLSSGLRGESRPGAGFDNDAIQFAMNSSVPSSNQRQENQRLSGGLELVDTEEATITEQNSKRDQSGLLPVFVVDGGLYLNNSQNSDEQ